MDSFSLLLSVADYFVAEMSIQLFSLELFFVASATMSSYTCGYLVAFSSFWWCRQLL